MDRNKDLLHLSLRDLHSSSKASSFSVAASPEGALLLGLVVTASSTLIRVHVGHKTYGQVALTDIHDGWVENPTEGLSEGMFVKCCVVGKTLGQEGNQFKLSLQASKGASWPGQGSAKQSPTGTPVPAVTSVKELKEGQQVACVFRMSRFSLQRCNPQPLVRPTSAQEKVI